MPSVNYFNRSAPFWDFVADLESQGSNHPLFAGRNREAGDESGPSNFPWNWVRGPTAPHFDESTHPDGPPPPFDQHDPSCDIPDPPPPPPPLDGEGPPPPPPPGPHGPHGHHGPRHWGGRRGRGGCNGRGRGGFPFGPRGGRSWGGPFGGPGGPFNLNALAEFFQEQMLGGGNSENNRNTDNSEVTRAGDDFKPLVDVFDTESSFVIHVSIPGAKKEDVAVSWDADKSELNVTGVVHRPGDEEFLKTLALDERQVGAFERKVRLGSRATPAQVDVDAITAKLEDGILRIEVPKEDRDYVDIKKVDIE